MGGTESKIIKSPIGEKMLIRINANLGKEKILGDLENVEIPGAIFNFPL